MSKDEIAQNILFTGDESDMLFFRPNDYAPNTTEIINNFTNMLGDAGEEFILEVSTIDTGTIGPALSSSIGVEYFDIDHIVETAEQAQPQRIFSDELGSIVLENDESLVDLDQLFDAMQISAIPGFEEPGISAPEISRVDMPLDVDTSLLSVPGSDMFDAGASIDDLFKKMILSDES